MNSVNRQAKSPSLPQPTLELIKGGVLFSTTTTPGQDSHGFSHALLSHSLSLSISLSVSLLFLSLCLYLFLSLSNISPTLCSTRLISPLPLSFYLSLSLSLSLPN